MITRLNNLFLIILRKKVYTYKILIIFAKQNAKLKNMRNIRSYNKLCRMPLRELFYQNPTLLAIPSNDFIELVVQRCQDELGIKETNYFTLKKLVLNQPTNEFKDLFLVEQSKGAWFMSDERKLIKSLKK